MIAWELQASKSSSLADFRFDRCDGLSAPRLSPFSCMSTIHVAALTLNGDDRWGTLRVNHELFISEQKLKYYDRSS